MEKVESDISMKKYLLGELTESEQQELEERLMTSNECFEQLLAAEDDLVDEYLRGTLSPREQEKFDDHFLCTPERREKLKFSRSLKRYVSAHAKRSRIVWVLPSFFSFLRASYVTKGWSMATALLLVLLGGSWLSVRVQLLQRALEQVPEQQVIPATVQQESQQQLAELRQRNDQLSRELQQQQRQRGALEQELAALKNPPPPRSTSSMVAFALIPGRVRDMGAMNNVVIPPGVKWAQLQLDLGAGDYKQYRALLQKDDSQEIWSQITPSIKTGDNVEAVVLTVPAKLLPHGGYILKLSGMAARGDFEDVATYQFKVVQK